MASREFKFLEETSDAPDDPRNKLLQFKLKWYKLIAGCNLALLFITSRLFELIRGDAGPVLLLERQAADRDMLNWKPPKLSKPILAVFYAVHHERLIYILMSLSIYLNLLTVYTFLF